MICVCNNSALTAYNTASQVLPANGLVNFTTNRILSGKSISHASNSTDIGLKRGRYIVLAHFDFTPTAAGDITFQLLNRNNAVAGEKVTVTSATGDTYTAVISTLIDVDPSCIAVNNNGLLQVQVSAGVTITNASISVLKVL